MAKIYFQSWQLLKPMLSGQLYVATSRVGSPDSVCFAVKKTELGCRPFLTPNVVYREILLNSQEDDMQMLFDESMDDDMLRLCNEPMENPPAAAPLEVTIVDAPRDTDYERPYSGVSLEEEQDECDGGPDPAPAGHRWPRLRGRTDATPNCDEGRPLPHPRDFFPLPSGPHIDPPLSAYELIREANILVSAPQKSYFVALLFRYMTIE